MKILLNEITLETYDRPGFKKYFAKFIYWSLWLNLCALWSTDCEDLQQFRKGFSQDELESCQILN